MSIVKNSKTKKEQPIQIEIGEWWYKGCFIQEQNHPSLSKYVVFKDNKAQSHVGTPHNFAVAKKMCEDNEVKDYVLGWKSFI